MITVLDKRLTDYPTTLTVRSLHFVLQLPIRFANLDCMHYLLCIAFQQEDEALLAATDPSSQLSDNRRNATIVALGEKRILTMLLSSLREAFPVSPPTTTTASSKAGNRSATKRGRHSHDDGEAPKDKKTRTY